MVVSMVLDWSASYVDMNTPTAKYSQFFLVSYRELQTRDSSDNEKLLRENRIIQWDWQQMKNVENKRPYRNIQHRAV